MVVPFSVWCHNNREVKIVRTINVALLMTSRITSVFNDSAREG